MKKTVSSEKLLESLMAKDNEIKKLRKENSRLKEALLTKFMEGDEVEDEESDDESADDNGDDEEVDVDEAMDDMSDNVLQNLNAPKNLVLDDGTRTNIAIDSSQDNVDIGVDEDNAYKISYNNGNWDSFTNAPSQFSTKITTIRQTVTPLLEKALIELIGNSGAYERVSFYSTAGFDDNNLRVTAEYHYQVDLYIVSEDDDKAKVMHDQGYIYQTLSQVPNLKINSTKIDTDTGDITVIVSI